MLTVKPLTLIQGFTKTKKYVVQTYHLKSHPEGKRKNNNTLISHCTIKFEAGAKEQNITRTSIIEIYPHSLKVPASGTGRERLIRTRLIRSST